MAKLNKDILFLIFEELQVDSTSLFSCLMVNRIWCETVIPILWRNPWCYDINYSNKNYLFMIIASYLSDDIKEFLTRQGIQLQPVLFQPLLFDYLSFCRSINVNTLNTITSIGSSLAYNQFLLQQEFYCLFMKKFQELKCLDMNLIKHQIFYIPEAKNRLESLCELKCDTSIDPSYFYGLARICQFIQRLIIAVNIVPKSNSGIAKLIEVQKNLKYFEWTDDFDVDYFIDDPYKEIFLELEKKAGFLNHLKLSFLYTDSFDYTIMQRLLLKLHNIKTLKINDLSFIYESTFKTLVYNNLEILNIDYITIGETSIIIENSGGHLKEVSLKPHDFIYYQDNFSDESLIFIRKIYENCPSIEYLSLAFLPSKNHFIEFEKLLQVCQNLKSLILITSNYYETEETEEEVLENRKEILKILIKSAPTNLREIRFFSDFNVSLEVLEEEFLEKWRDRPALSILTSNSIYKGEDYKNLINKYKNNGQDSLVEGYWLTKSDNDFPVSNFKIEGNESERTGSRLCNKVHQALQSYARKCNKTAWFEVYFIVKIKNDGNDIQISDGRGHRIIITDEKSTRIIWEE
ncbi:9566_t:CDS:2 [Rhizophagus irregularis]|nr:9566_t:CDS:2 [Rhizophagus irregularis]